MITDLIRELVIYGKNNGLICEADEVYATNRLLELFDVMEYEENPEITESRAVCEILEDMMTYAHENGIMKEGFVRYEDHGLHYATAKCGTGRIREALCGKPEGSNQLLLPV